MRLTPYSLSAGWALACAIFACQVALCKLATFDAGKFIICPMTAPPWPDPLQKPDPTRIQRLLDLFWHELAKLADLIRRDEHLLCAHCTAGLRDIVTEMMLALNGIAWPSGTSHLNAYLSTSQRAAIDKTLLAPTVDGDGWIGQAVALVVIYRWYAPQLVAEYELLYPQAIEEATWTILQDQLPDWPISVTTA